MRRFLSALGVAGLAGVLILGTPASVQAASLPDPVDPLQVLPSTTQRALTGSPMGNAAFTDIARAATAWVKGSPASIPTINVPPPPKLISGPAQFAKGNVAVLAPGIAWALASNGTLVAVSIASGQSYEDVFCSQPGWYQGVSSFVQMSIAPDCSGRVLQPNSDVTAGITISAGGRTLIYKGTVTVNGQKIACLGGGSGAVVGQDMPGPGLSYVWTTLAGASSISNVPMLASQSNCGTGPVGAKNWTSLTTAMPVRVINSSTGATVATVQESDGNPSRTPRCRISAADGSFVVANGTPYKEADGMPMSAQGLGCTQAYEDFVSAPGRGPGFLPDKIEVESVEEGGSVTEIAESDVPDFTESERKGLTPGNNRGLVLSKVVADVVRSCMTWEVDCVGWWDSSTQGTKAPSETPYRCTFNGESVGLAECGVYRYTFDAQTQTPTITDPGTGQPAPWTSSPPNVNTTPAPGTPGSEVTGGGGCALSFSLNPVDWVMNPLKCLFIPSQASIDAFQGRVDDGVENSVIGSVLGGLGTLGEAFDSGVGCGGLPIHLEAFGTVIVHSYLLESCSEPAAGIAATAKTVMTVGVWGGAILATMRYVGALFAFTAYGSDHRGGRSGVSFD